MKQASAVRPSRVRTWLALSLLPAAALALPLVAARTAPTAGDDLAFTAEQAKVARDVVIRLNGAHYGDTALDDRLSEEVLDRYLDFLDPSRTHFLAADVERFEAFRFELDEALAAGDLKPAFEIFERYQERRLHRLELAGAWLAPEAELPRYGKGETLELDRSEAPWPADEAAAEELWRRLLANEVLELELAGRDDAEARDLLVRRNENRLQRAKQMNSGDVVRVFLNAFAQSLDPHTEYFPPKAATDFDIQMSLSVEGIGALLSADGAYVEIERLIPGGPAEGSGRLSAADRIAAVAQGDDGEFVDVVGWRVDEVAELVRGARGTVVRLQILSTDQAEGAAPREVRIVREKVKLEEAAATSRVVEVPGPEGQPPLRIGVIDLPAFYLDFEARAKGEDDYRSSTNDVERLLRELVADGVDGVLLDLRANGGGSLDEAVGVAELFLGAEPVVQIRDAGGRAQTLSGEREAVYGGPFAVLIDRLSASASEILAGAIQDHGRGPVVGSRTFGKGTVQVLAPARAGEIKVTRAMFYRASGDSTQSRGIEPDVPFPSQYDEDEIGESALDNALPFDRIRAVPGLGASAVPALVPALVERHVRRAAESSDLERLAQRMALVEEVRARRTVALELDERRAETEVFERRRLEIDNRWRVARGLEPVEDLDDAEEGVDEPEGPDAVAREAAAVLADFLRLRNPTGDETARSGR